MRHSCLALTLLALNLRANFKRHSGCSKFLRLQTESMPYTLIEHTADIGIHVDAEDVDTLFADAGRGLFAIISGDLNEIESTHLVKIKITGHDRDYLMLDWLTELLIRFDLEHLLFCEFNVEVNSNGLTATAQGEPIDFSRHRLLHEVKAVTYHGLSVKQTAQGWTADVLLDI
jgi:SHS2 domain-containing protein